MKFTLQGYLSAFLFLLLISSSCGDKGGSTPNPPSNPCNGVTVTVSGTTTSPTVIGASDGSVTASASGASGFTFNINGGAFQSSGTFTGLAAGSYTISAKSSAGCTGSSSFTVAAPPNPCAGVTIIVTGTSTNPTSTTSNNGSIVASATGSTGFTFSINSGAFQASGTFSNLGTGVHTITAKDVNGCTGSANFTLTAPNPCAGVTITVSGTTTNPTSPTANNGSIAASATGSTGFTFSINGGAFQASGNFTNLPEGTHLVTAKDLNGCIGSTNFTLTAPNPCTGVTISVSATATQNIPCEAVSAFITATASGGTSPYTYSRNGTTFQVSNIFNGLATANYTITAKDANGCIGSTSSSVTNAPAGPLFTAVRAVLQANCAVSGCHNGSQPPNWTIDCNIVANSTLIQQRAVSGNPSPMPPTGLMPANERQKITDWINAGGKFNN
jgi:SprB repeat